MPDASEPGMALGPPRTILQITANEEPVTKRVVGRDVAILLRNATVDDTKSPYGVILSTGDVLARSYQDLSVFSGPIYIQSSREYF